MRNIRTKIATITPVALPALLLTLFAQATACTYKGLPGSVAASGLASSALSTENTANGQCLMRKVTA